MGAFLELGPARFALLIPALAALGACDGGGHFHSGPPPPPPPPPGPDFLTEFEPNDSPYHPDFIGHIDSLSHLVIEGHVDAGWGDLYDHFEFVADQPMEIEFALYGLGPASDLDVAIWDPYFEEYVLWYDSPWDPELGAFAIHAPGKVFQIMVRSYLFDDAYELEIIGRPFPYSAAVDDPLDAQLELQDELAPAITRIGEQELFKPELIHAPQAAADWGSVERGAATEPERLTVTR